MFLINFIWSFLTLFSDFRSRNIEFKRRSFNKVNFWSVQTSGQCENYATSFNFISHWIFFLIWKWTASIGFISNFLQMRSKLRFRVLNTSRFENGGFAQFSRKRLNLSLFIKSLLNFACGGMTHVYLQFRSEITYFSWHSRTEKRPSFLYQRSGFFLDKRDF